MFVCVSNSQITWLKILGPTVHGTSEAFYFVNSWLKQRKLTNIRYRRRQCCNLQTLPESPMDEYQKLTLILIGRPWLRAKCRNFYLTEKVFFYKYSQRLRFRSRAPASSSHADMSSFHWQLICPSVVCADRTSSPYSGTLWDEMGFVMKSWNTDLLFMFLVRIWGSQRCWGCVWWICEN